MINSAVSSVSLCEINLGKPKLATIRQIVNLSGKTQNIESTYLEFRLQFHATSRGRPSPSSMTRCPFFGTKSEKIMVR